MNPWKLPPADLQDSLPYLKGTSKRRPHRRAPQERLHPSGTVVGRSAMEASVQVELEQVESELALEASAVLAELAAMQGTSCRAR